MKSHKLQIIMFCLTALAALLLPSNAHADGWNKATKVTFAEPVEVSGTVLQSGSYWFELMDNASDRHIVQIWNADRTRLITTILAIPNYRLSRTGETVIKFDERPSGTPEAIKAWFYPGDNFGQEFVYHKARASQFAQIVDQPVLSVRDDQATAPAAVLEQAPVKAVEPSGEEVEVAEAHVPAMTAEALPKTASLLPLLGLLGLVTFAAGFTLRSIVGDEA